MEKGSGIYQIIAKQILDSRGFPTLETTVITNSGYRGMFSVPSGTSTGKYEAWELRDNDPNHYQGFGVLQAVDHVNRTISPKLKNFDVLKQIELDQLLIEMDGTTNKQSLGANALIGVSLAAACAAANFQRLPLYRYLNQIYNQHASTPELKMPIPIMEMLNGGKHGSGNLDFQEFHIISSSNKPYKVALEVGVNLYQNLRKLLIHRKADYSVGYEGGFTPNLLTNLEAFDIIAEIIQQAKLAYGREIFMGVDIASSHFKSDRGYLIKDRADYLSSQDLLDYYLDLHKRYHLLFLEDAFGEDDWDGWSQLTRSLGREAMIVGDDLLVTNLEKINKAVQTQACNAIILKPNQIGTLSEFFTVAAAAGKAGYKKILSHRSGETCDTFIADLSVAINADYVKFGAPARGERVVKYNRLLQIESEINR